MEAAETAVVHDLLDGLHGGGRVWRVWLDMQSTQGRRWKTTDRQVYTQARARRRIGDAQEVLMWNEHGCITEGSITNVAFQVDGKWITPDLSSGCLDGVCRRHLLRQGWIQAGQIRRQDIHGKCILFNAVQGVVRGIVESNRGAS